MNNVHYSSRTGEWSTPQYIFNHFDKDFHFNLDVCADSTNNKCQSYYHQAQDGLSLPWIGSCWMNPPYGRGIGQWLEKAHRAGEAGSVIVCLIPSRTDTTWWHQYVTKGQVHFLRGRLKFGGASSSAPFPSAVVIFGNGEPSVDWLDLRHLRN